jgi:hypothetical protein
MLHIQKKKTKQINKLGGLSPLTNYTDRGPLLTKLVPTFADRGVSRSQRDRSPTAVIFVF